VSYESVILSYLQEVSKNSILQAQMRPLKSNFGGGAVLGAGTMRAGTTWLANDFGTYPKVSLS
jgi:hypothetical protein